MSFVFLLVGVLVSFLNLIIGFIINIIAIIISIIEIKKYNSLGKLVFILSVILLIFQGYFLYKKNGDLNKAKLTNAETTINYIRKSAELYYMNYYYLNESKTNNVIFICDGKKCYHDNDKLDIVGSIPSSGIIIITSNNDNFNIVGKDVMILDLICDFERFGKIDCVQK